MREIGDDIVYNLQFKLPPISEHLNLPINAKVLDIYSSREALPSAAIPHEAAAHYKIYLAALRSSDTARSMDTGRRCDAAQDDEGLLVERHPYSSPAPE